MPYQSLYQSWDTFLSIGYVFEIRLFEHQTLLSLDISKGEALLDLLLGAITHAEGAQTEVDLAEVVDEGAVSAVDLRANCHRPLPFLVVLVDFLDRLPCHKVSFRRGHIQDDRVLILYEVRVHVQNRLPQSIFVSDAR